MEVRAVLIVVDVATWYDWRLRHRRDLREGEPHVPDLAGADFVRVRTQQNSKSQTTISIPDSDIDRMSADHEEARRNAQTGYEAKHEGGADHGRMKVVAPRPVPAKSKAQLIGDHLEFTVMPYHAPTEGIKRVRVLEAAGMEEGERKRLEKYLTARLAGGTE